MKLNMNIEYLRKFPHLVNPISVYELAVVANFFLTQSLQAHRIWNKEKKTKDICINTLF